MKLWWFDKPDCAGCKHPYHLHRLGALLLCYKDDCNCFQYVCPCGKPSDCEFFKEEHDEIWLTIKNRRARRRSSLTVNLHERWKRI